MKRLSPGFISFALFLFPFSSPSAFAEPATKEDIRLLRQELKEDIKVLREEMGVLNEQTNRRIDDLRETMFWLFGTFISINIIILGFILKVQWQMHRRLQIAESTQESIKQGLETQQDEINFLKGLVEKLVTGKQ